MRSQASPLIGAHETRIAGHIGGENGGKAAGRDHGWAGHPGRKLEFVNYTTISRTTAPDKPATTPEDPETKRLPGTQVGLRLASECHQVTTTQNESIRSTSPTAQIRHQTLAKSGSGPQWSELGAAVMRRAARYPQVGEFLRGGSRFSAGFMYPKCDLPQRPPGGPILPSSAVRPPKKSAAPSGQRSPARECWRLSATLRRDR